MKLQVIHCGSGTVVHSDINRKALRDIYGLNRDAVEKKIRETGSFEFDNLGMEYAVKEVTASVPSRPLGIQYSGLFNSPESWEALDKWIKQHPAHDQVVAYTTLQMFINYILDNASTVEFIDRDGIRLCLFPEEKK